MSTKAKKLRNYLIYSGIAASLALFVTSDLGKGVLLNTLTAFGYGGETQAPSAPSSLSSSNASLSLNTYQNGVVSNNYPGNNKIDVEIPQGAVPAGQQASFDIRGSRGNIADYLPVANGFTIGQAQEGGGFSLLSNYIFDIIARDINNNIIHDFNRELTITITVPNLPQDTNGIGVYYLDPNTQHWLLMPIVSIDPATGVVKFKTTHLSTFAVFKISGMPSEVRTAISIQKEQLAALRDFADGSLIRTPNGKIYVILNSQRKYISSISELSRYAGQTINEVGYDVLEQYTELAPAPTYSNGTLLKSPSGRIYVIINQNKHWIRSWSELRQYAGKKIISVSDDVLAQY